MRWQLEVTFQEVRRHLGFETQRPVDPGADLLRVAGADQHGKSPMGLHGTADRRGLLRSLMAKVELHALRRIRNAKDSNVFRSMIRERP